MCVFFWIWCRGDHTNLLTHATLFGSDPPYTWYGWLNSQMRGKRSASVRATDHNAPRALYLYIGPGHGRRQDVQSMLFQVCQLVGYRSALICSCVGCVGWLPNFVLQLGHGSLVDFEANRAYLMLTQNSYGGFSKWQVFSGVSCLGGLPWCLALQGRSYLCS